MLAYRLAHELVASMIWREIHSAVGSETLLVEAPKGEFGVYLVSDGTNRPLFPEPWAHAGRHHGDPRLARYCVRGNRPVINLAVLFVTNA